MPQFFLTVEVVQVQEVAESSLDRGIFEEGGQVERRQGSFFFLFPHFSFTRVQARVII